MNNSNTPRFALSNLSNTKPQNSFNSQIFQNINQKILNSTPFSMKKPEIFTKDIETPSNLPKIEKKFGSSYEMKEPILKEKLADLEHLLENLTSFTRNSMKDAFFQNFIDDFEVSIEQEQGIESILEEYRLENEIIIDDDNKPLYIEENDI